MGFVRSAARLLGRYLVALIAWGASARYAQGRFLTDAFKRIVYGRKLANRDDRGASGISWLKAIGVLEEAVAQPPRRLALAELRKSAPDNPFAKSVETVRATAFSAARRIQLHRLRRYGLAIEPYVRIDAIIGDVGLTRAPQMVRSIYAVVRASYGDYYNHPQERERALRLLRQLRRKRWIKVG